MPEELTLLPCPACGASDVVMRVDTRAYVFCTACGMCGPCAPKADADYAIRQWNALPRALTWTDEQPKVPGWYWFRNGGAKPVILSITLPVKWKAEPDDEWAGPIPEPREPKE